MAGEEVRDDCSPLPASRRARRPAAGARGPPPRPRLSRGGGPLGRGPGAAPVERRPRATTPDAVVADARRRALGDPRAARRGRHAARVGPGGSPRPADAADRADAEPRRRRALRTPQRAGDRRQSRRARAGDARGTAAEGAAGPLRARARLQPARPGPAHHDRRHRRPRHDLAAGGGWRRAGDAHAGPRPCEARVLARGADALAVRPGRRRALRRGLEPARLRRQPDRLGHPRGADRERRRARRARAGRPHPAQLRGAARRPPGPRARRPRRRGPGALRGAEAQRRGAVRRRAADRRAPRPADGARALRRGRRLRRARRRPCRFRVPFRARGGAVAHPRGRRRPAARSGAPDRPHGPPRRARVHRLRARARGERVARRTGARRDRAPGRRAAAVARERVRAGGGAGGGGTPGGAPAGPSSRSSSTTGLPACSPSSGRLPLQAARAWPRPSTPSRQARGVAPPASDPSPRSWPSSPATGTASLCRRPCWPRTGPRRWSCCGRCPPRRSTRPGSSSRRCSSTGASPRRRGEHGGTLARPTDPDARART